MAIFQLVAREFSRDSRTRGEEYFLNHRVEILRNGSFFAQLGVHGSSGTYTVNFDFKYGVQELYAHCSCPCYEKGNFCKHIWASLLKLDDEKIFPNAHNLRRLKLRRSEETFSHKAIESNPSRTREPSWQDVLQKTKEREMGETQTPPKPKANQKVAQFVLDVDSIARRAQLCVQTYFRERLRNGQWSSYRPMPLNRAFLPHLINAGERDALRALINAHNPEPFSFHQNKSNLAVIGAEDSRDILEALSASGNLMIRQNGNLHPYPFESAKWWFQLQVRQVEHDYFLSGYFTNGTISRQTKEGLAVVGGVLLFPDFCASLNTEKHREWIELFGRRKELEIQNDELDVFLDGFYSSQDVPPLELPPSLAFKVEKHVEPRVQLVISYLPGSPTLLQFELLFTYNHKTIRFDYSSEEIVDGKYRTKIMRDRAFESSALETMKPFREFGLAEREVNGAGILRNENFIPLVETGLNRNWEVIAHQKPMRLAKDFNIQITSGVDWFDLSAKFQFDHLSLTLPQLLLNLKSNDRFIALGDGTFGILPQEWLAKFGALAEIAKETNQGLRFSRVQALFVTSLLPENEKLKVDQKFSTLSQLIKSLRHLEPVEPGDSFKGTLRSYQKDGLAWLEALRKQDLGGILADDMGLGKTIQVLALLTNQPGHGPNLIVAPKSLIFNWIKESEKFAPDLKILNLTGSKRLDSLRDIRRYDLVLTTYQSLRMDIDFLKDIEFNHFILDEAQNIKNPKSQMAMACRLIQARTKLALSGTPIENSLLDLFSILSVVLPGLVSDAQANRWVKENDADTLKVLSQALSPFILRRTKEQVLKDLPEKSEQVLYCELSDAEMRKYNELKSYFWRQLSGQVEEKGLSQSKFQILEALLRLRQAACHQGLLDKKMATQPSAKFEMLFDQMDSIIKDGHKALVFSQFTSLLGLLERELKERQIPYEYLDGKTKDRESRIENFQTNPDIKLFLLSLKVGGVGLNLTAADYVFILDPWWNPAAESQAIDRTHRIGQNKKVLAYRLIAKNTVEEKILELQDRKRNLAKTIVSDEKSILKSLKLEDLQDLFT
jgi:SNF2 family DNA or RNA helicase